MKVSIPSLPKNYNEGSCSKETDTGKAEAFGKDVKPVEPKPVEPKPVESTAPISTYFQKKTVFTPEEEDKLKKMVSEYDFNMFMTAKEKAAKLVVRK